MLRYVLLGALSYEPMTGYDLKTFMDHSTAHFWHARQSQIYSTLKQLEQAGYLESDIYPQPDRPDRRVYSITDSGREQLREWLAKPMTDLSPVKSELLLRVFFGAQIDKVTLLAQLRLQRSLLEAILTRYRNQTPDQIQDGVAEHPELSRDAMLWEATRRLGEQHTAVYVRWLDETIEMVESNF